MHGELKVNMKQVAFPWHKKGNQYIRIAVTRQSTPKLDTRRVQITQVSAFPRDFSCHFN